MPGRQYTSTAYRYGFNDKEKDDEVKGTGNSIDFGARVHDPRLGRFLSVDPWTQKYPWNTPYSYADNKVIDHIDIEGKGTGSFMMPITMSWELRASALAQKYVKEGASPRDANIRAHLEVALAGSAVVVAGAAIWWAINNPLLALRNAGEMVFQELSGIPIISNPLTLLEGAAERGLYKGSLKGLSSLERQRAAEYVADGSKLERIEEGTTPTADFIIDGKVTEFKAVQSQELNPNTAVGLLQEATKKEGVQVIDLDIRKPGGSVKDADAIYDRFKNSAKGKAFKGEVRIATQDGLKKYPAQK